MENDVPEESRAVVHVIEFYDGDHPKNAEGMLTQAVQQYQSSTPFGGIAVGDFVNTFPWDNRGFEGRVYRISQVVHSVSKIDRVPYHRQQIMFKRS